MLKKIKKSILGKGKSKLELRKSIFDKVNRIVYTNLSKKLEVKEVELYIEKIAKNAYKITNQDLNALKNLGFSEDEIFELTIVAAFSAGASRVELVSNFLTD